MIGTEHKKSIIKAAVSRLLSGLVRLCMLHGIGFREFSDISKRVFFDAGKDLLLEEQVKLTESRLSVLTGLHRKDLSTLMQKSGAGKTLTTKETSPCAAIVANWISNPAYTNEKGLPLALPYQNADHNTPTFYTLAEEVSKDVRPRALLDEMIRLGQVKLSNNQKNPFIVLEKAAFLPDDDLEEKLGFLVRNNGDHLKAAISNIEGTSAPFFDRSAFHDNLSAADIEFLRQLVSEKGMDFLKEIYRKAENMPDTTTASGDRMRMTCGIYFFAEPSYQEDPDDQGTD